MNNTTYHTSVLLPETLEYLDVKPGKKYIDATLGGGGHTRAILEKGGSVLGIDQDNEAIEHVKDNLKFEIGNLKLEIHQGNFKEINVIAKTCGFEKVSGVLMDLGVSGHQFDTAERGFSFQKEGMLDMRMDDRLSVRAGDLVNGLTKLELERILTELGEEPFAKRIVGEICKKRAEQAITTTLQLKEIVFQSLPRGVDKITSAARVFQALRIAVNDELYSLADSLPKAFDLLEKNGRLVVISFHSLEDRIVKQTFKKLAEEKKGMILTEKPIVPTETEKMNNSRSRSAKLRVIEKNI